MRHFIHYLSREINVRSHKKSDILFYAEEQDEKEGFKRPMFHITRRTTGPVKRIEKGSIIWLFSVLKAPWGTFPPSLDAMFIVERVEYLADGRIKFYSNKNSKWFPLFDASKLIESLNTIDVNGNQSKLRKDTSKPLGFYLQSIRETTDGNLMMNWSDRIMESKFDFISYRIKDGTKLAFFTAKDLVENGKIVFWDRFSLPRRLAERREYVNSATLDVFLMKQIKNCSCVWGIISLMYAHENSYSLKEKTLAERLRKFKPIDRYSVIPKIFLLA